MPCRDHFLLSNWLVASKSLPAMTVTRPARMSSESGSATSRTISKKMMSMAHQVFFDAILLCVTMVLWLQDDRLPLAHLLVKRLGGKLEVFFSHRRCEVHARLRRLEHLSRCRVETPVAADDQCTFRVGRQRVLFCQHVWDLFQSRQQMRYEHLFHQQRNVDSVPIPVIHHRYNFPRGHHCQIHELSDHVIGAYLPRTTSEIRQTLVAETASWRCSSVSRAL